VGLCDLAEVPFLQELHEEYRGRLALLAVSQKGDDVGPVAHVVSQLQLAFPFLVDPDGEACRRYEPDFTVGACMKRNLYFLDGAGVVRSCGHFPYPDLTREDIRARCKALANGD
jgi:peroxiredoxin